MIAHHKNYKKIKKYCIALAISTDFTGMVISCVIYGLGIGGITGLTVVVLVQSLGMEKLTSAFGLNVFIGGLIVFPGIIIIGKFLNLNIIFQLKNLLDLNLNLFAVTQQVTFRC